MCLWICFLQRLKLMFFEKNHESTCAFCAAREKPLILSFCKKKFCVRKFLVLKFCLNTTNTYFLLYYFAAFRALYMILQICWVVLISAVIDRSESQLQLPNKYVVFCISMIIFPLINSRSLFGYHI